MVHIKRNFTLSVACCMGIIMLGDFKVIHIKQVFHFNCIRNEFPLYVVLYLPYLSLSQTNVLKLSPNLSLGPL